MRCTTSRCDLIAEAEQANDGSTDDNVAMLRATGKLDAIESVEAKKATARTLLGEPLTDPLRRSAIIPDVVIQDNTVDIGMPEHPVNAENFALYKEVCAAGNITMPFWDWLDAGKPTSMPSEPVQATGTPTREYDVTWRRPTAAYAHDIVEAASAEEALMIAKARVTSRNKFDGSFPYFETDTDSMDPCDWISVEGHNEVLQQTEHTEWEEPKPSAGVLVKALNQILAVVVTSASDIDDPAMLRQALSYIEDFAREALNEAIPQ